MKTFFRFVKLACVGIFLASPSLSPAQVRVALNLPFSKALLFEQVTAVVSIQNNSGRLLSFGAEPGMANLSFHVEDVDGRLVRPLTDGPLLRDIDVMPGESRSISINLTSSHRIRFARLYKIKAVVEWDSVCYASQTAFLDIVKGTELARLKAGIPGDPAARRLYILEFIQRGREEHVYFRIEDEADDLSYGTFNLGRIVRSSKPEIRVDSAGNVHLFFPTIGMKTVHVSYTPYGRCLFSNVIEDLGEQKKD